MEILALGAVGFGGPADFVHFGPQQVELVAVIFEFQFLEGQVHQAQDVALFDGVALADEEAADDAVGQAGPGAAAAAFEQHARAAHVGGQPAERAPERRRGENSRQGRQRQPAARGNQRQAFLEAVGGRQFFQRILAEQGAHGFSPPYPVWLAKRKIFRRNSGNGACRKLGARNTGWTRPTP